MIKKILFIFCLFLAVAACSQQEQVSKPTTPLVINTINGDITFNVEVAKTPDELQQGLMHRKEIGLNSGMIFDIYPVRPIAMWMKNTYIALDMLFIAPDTTISMIKENAQPLSEEHIISRSPVRAVVEIPAGNVQRYNIKIGDKVQHAILDNMVDITEADNSTNDSDDLNNPTDLDSSVSDDTSIPAKPEMFDEDNAESATENDGEADTPETSFESEDQPASELPELEDSEEPLSDQSDDSANVNLPAVQPLSL